MADHHDALFHKVCSRPEQARALLQCALPTGLHAAIDWERFCPVPAEFKNGRLLGHRADVLFMAPLRGDPRRSVYLLLEHKFGPGLRAGLQVQRYVHRVHQRHREHFGPDEPEPVIVPVLVQFGRRRGRHRAGQRAAATQAPVPADALPFLVSRQQVVCDLTEREEASVRALPLPPLCLLMVLCQQFLPGAASAAAVACLGHWADLLDRVAEEDPGEDLAAVCSYILRVTDMSFAELQALIDQMFADKPKEVFMSTAEKLRELGRREGRKEGLQQGLEQGVQQGEAQGRADLLLRQLAARFGPLPEPVESRVRTAPVAELDRWALAVLTAATLADVFAG